MLERANTNRPLPQRDLCSGSGQTMRVKLVRKFANVLNGIDLTKANIGDVLNLPPFHAAMLVAEGWAEDASHSGVQTIELTTKDGGVENGE
jgi:hypothetical protein